MREQGLLPGAAAKKRAREEQPAEQADDGIPRALRRLK